MAEAVLRKFLVSRAIDADIDSAGTHDYCEQLPAHPMALATAKRRGYDLTSIVARRLRPHDFQYFDLLVAMDRNIHKYLWSRHPRPTRQKILLLMDFAESYPGRDVPDPYGRGPSAFDDALDRIEAGCIGLARAVLLASQGGGGSRCPRFNSGLPVQS